VQKLKGFYGMILSVSAKVDSYSDNALSCLPAADLDEAFQSHYNFKVFTYQMTLYNA